MSESAHPFDHPKYGFLLGVLGLCGVGLSLMAPDLFWFGAVICYACAILTLVRYWPDLFRVKQRIATLDVGGEAAVVIVALMLEVFLPSYLIYVRYQKPTRLLASVESSLTVQPAVKTAESLDNYDFNEILPGYAYFMAARINQLNGRIKQPIFDIEFGAIKIVFYATTSNMFRFSVIDSHNDEHSTDINLGYDGVRVGVPKLLFFEVGSGTDYSVMRVCSDGVEVSRRTFSFPIDFGDRRLKSFGGSDFDMTEMISFSSTLDRLTLKTVSQRAATMLHLHTSPLAVVPPTRRQPKQPGEMSLQTSPLQACW